MYDKDQKILFLQELLLSEGWKIVESELDEMVNQVENKLFGEDDDFDDTKKLDELEYELLRRQRKHLIALKNFPNQLIAVTNLNESTPIAEYDPYE